MRGKDESSGGPFSDVDLETRVPRDDPLRAIRDLTNAALVEMSGKFEELYSRTGRPGIAPEKLLRALLLQAFYSIRSERQLMEQLGFHLLFRWFVGLGIDDRSWDASSKTSNTPERKQRTAAAGALEGVGLAARCSPLVMTAFGTDETVRPAHADGRAVVILLWPGSHTCGRLGIRYIIETGARM